jgi:hypothetical protein
MKTHSISINPKILKASNVKTIDPVSLQLAESLATIDVLKFVKIYNEKMKASNFLSENKKKEPITEIGKDGVVGVELLIDLEYQTIQFYSLTSASKGYGRKIVKAVNKSQLIEAMAEELKVPVSTSSDIVEGLWHI